MSCLKKWIKNIKSRLIFVYTEGGNIIAEARMFYVILLRCYSFYIIPPWCNANHVSKRQLLLRHFLSILLWAIFKVAAFMKSLSYYTKQRPKLLTNNFFSVPFYVSFYERIFQPPDFTKNLLFFVNIKKC